VLVALILVNLPFVHQQLTDREVARNGREVEAVVLEARTVGDRHLVDYRLPRSADPDRTRFSARIDEETFAQARETKALAVRVVPGEPAANRPAGQVANPLFTVVALTADAVLLLVGLLLWRRWRRSSRYEVVAVGDGSLTLASPTRTLVASAPAAWVTRTRPGEQVSGRLHLVAAGDVVPGPVAGRDRGHVDGPTQVVRGRVVDARAGRVVLELDDGTRLRVETRRHRIRADIRDFTEVTGTLCFTPRGSR
jgi:hypothetical protein